MIAWFARNGVATNLLFILIIVGGLVAATQVKIELFPEFSTETITISVPYPGAAPEEVEEGINRRIEDRVYDLDGIKRLTSTAAEGFGVVVVEVARGYDVRRVLEDVKNRVDGIDTFPVDAEEPVIEEVLIKRETISVAVYGDADEVSLKTVAEQMRDEITRLPGVSQAEVQGVRAYEISIEVDESTLRRLGIRFEEVVNAVRESSLEVPGGSIRASSGEILLRASAKAETAPDFASIVLRARNSGEVIRLGDVATIRDGFIDEPLIVRFNGQPAAIIRVYEVGDQNPLRISRAIKNYAANVDWLPGDLRAEAWRDLSIYLRDRLSLLLRNGAVGFGLVLLVLALFLRPLLAFFVALGIPVSFLGTVLIMPAFDLTINLVSLFGFILVLGIVVDDAIVVGESVFSEFQKNGPGVEGAIRGTHAVSLPVTFAVLTTIVAFMPIFFLPGFIGKFFFAIPAVVIPTLLWSLVESKLILPYHLSLIRVGKRDRTRIGGLRRIQLFFADGLEWFVERFFRPSLAFGLRYRYAVAAAFVTILLISVGLVAGNRVRFTFISPVPSDYVATTLEMPVGTPFEMTVATLDQVESALDRVLADLAEQGIENPVKHHSISIGAVLFEGGGPGGVSSSSNTPEKAEITIELVPPEIRPISAPEIAKLWRNEVGTLPGVRELSFGATAAGGAGSPVDVQLTGPDLGQLQAAARDLRERLAEYEGLFDITDTLAEGKDEIQLRIRPEAEALGLRQSDLASQVRSAFFGAEAQRIQRDREDIRVMVRYPEEDRRYLDSLRDLRIRLADGREVPFETVSEIEIDTGYASITRVDRRRALNVRADADKAVADVNLVIEELRTSVLPELAQTYPGIDFQLEGEAREQSDTFGSLKGGFLLVLLAIYALLAIPFKSYLQPFIVMIVIPFGFVGAVWGHLIIGQDLSILSILGLVALAGVVVNDSLVMVDYINKRRRNHDDLMIAIREAGAARFRPIILTSATTFVGLTPILLEKSLQAQFLIPMATSLAFGILFATFITLFLVPALYLMLEDLKSSIHFLSRRTKSPTVATSDDPTNHPTP